MLFSVHVFKDLMVAVTCPLASKAIAHDCAALMNRELNAWGPLPTAPFPGTSAVLASTRCYCHQALL